MRASFVLPLFLLGVADHAPMAMAQSLGTFTATGSMITPRAGHTATILLNGKVLIAGGSGFPNNLLAGAELYDPTTGAFTTTGNMTTARYWPSATLLPDGRVLVVGGSGIDGPLASAEIYDPSTGTFSAVANMPTARYLYTATLLHDGKVLILFSLADDTGWGAALYDPSTQAFTATGNAPGAAVQNATLLSDGRVFFDRGTDLNGAFHGGQLYDPSTSTFTPVGNALTPDTQYCCGYWDTATILINANVLLAGGGNGDIGLAFDSAALYDRARGALIPTGNMTTRRYGHRAAILPDGTALITGGASGCPPQGGDCTYINAGAEIYDPSTGAFTAAGSMTSARGSHAATLLPEGTVLISGGWACCPGHSIATAELYYPTVLIPAPALFSLSGDGRGQGAILHANTPRIASASDPAVARECLEIYLTGLADGSVIPPQVAIGGRAAEVLFFGKAPGYAGLSQINVRVPSGLAPRPAVPVRLTYLGRPSNEVTIGVQGDFGGEL